MFQTAMTAGTTVVPNQESVTIAVRLDIAVLDQKMT